MQTRTYKAIFFDLDGTLLSLDMDTFLKGYFGAVQKFTSERGYDGEHFMSALFAGTKAMTDTEGGFNSERFWSTFLSLQEGSREEIEALLEEFYATEFNAIGSSVVVDPCSAQILETLKKKGYPLYLTTMPLFPRIAVEARLKWAGCSPEVFDRITTYDNSTSTKPNLAYYQENVDEIGLNPEDILMVGNNTLEDLVAMDLGLDAYLVTNDILDPISFDIETVKHGTREDFLKFVQALPECE